MKKDKSYVFIILISLLLVINILLNFKISEFKKILRIHINSLNMKDQAINKLETGFKNYYLRTIKLNTDSFKKNNTALTKALSSGEKIICYVQKGVCTSCALRIMQDLSILEEVIGRDHTIIATNIEEKNYPLEFLVFEFPTIFIETFYFPEDFSKEPLVFVCDSLMNIKLLYLPETFPEFRKQYFNEYLPAYFESSKAL